MWRLLFTKNDPSHVFARYLGPVIIYRLGRAEDFGGYHLIFRRTKGGGSVVTENPKGGITENFGRIQRGITQFCLNNEDMGREIAKVIKCLIRGDHFSEVTFKGGLAKFHLV